MDQITYEQIGWGVSSILFMCMCALWGHYIAITKHRPWLEGVLMGCTLGPFGVIAASCMPTLVPVLEDDEQDVDVQDLAERLRRAPVAKRPSEQRFTDAEWAKRLSKSN